MVRAKTWLLVALVLPALVCAYAWAQSETGEPVTPGGRPRGVQMRAGVRAGGEVPLGGPMRKGDRMMALSPEQRQKFMEFLREYDPRVLQQLKKTQAERPGEFGKRLSGEWRRLGQLMMLREKDPKLFGALIKQRDLSRESRELASSVRAAKTEEEKEALREELAENLNQIYDLQQEMWEEKIAALEKRLNELREMLEKRAQHRGEIIERRIKELTGEEKYLNWEFPTWVEPSLPMLPEGEAPGADLPVVPTEEGGAE